MRFGEEQQLGKTGAENAGEPEVTVRTTEVRTDRGSAGLVRGGDKRCRADETSRKGKGKGNEGKCEHEGKGGGFGHKGKQQEETRERRNGSEWRQTWGPVAHTPRPCRIRGRERWRKEMQQRNEEKEEILKLLGEWQERESSPLVRWARADEIKRGREHRRTKRGEKAEKKKGKKPEG